MASTIPIPASTGFHPPAIAADLAAVAVAAKADIEELQRQGGGGPTVAPWIAKGNATLVAGHAEVSDVAVPAGASIQVTRNTAGGDAIGHLSAPAQGRTPTSFAIESSSRVDASTVDWVIHG